jgi:uncharacterized protein YbaR (Trm112 family)
VVFIELIDDLRCPHPHEETWLVASADRTHGRHIMEGTLGCPVCRAEYPIRAGVVSFGAISQTPARAPREYAEDREFALRLAAFLDLSDAQGVALLAGAFARYAAVLGDAVPTHLVLLNPDLAVVAGGGVSAMQVPNGLPLAEATCRGVALDAVHATASYLAAAVRVLRPRGRLVAPAASPTPDGVTELARDERLWVAERGASPPKLVSLRARDPTS